MMPSSIYKLDSLLRLQKVRGSGVKTGGGGVKQAGGGAVAENR